MGQSSKCLVIDTDIASSASERDTPDIRPKNCRELLLVTRDAGHKVVSTEAIRIEWQKHQSRFTRTWLASMIARKQICWVKAPADEQLRLNIEKYALSEKKRDAMLKDIHLIEAAMQTDRIVLSIDETVRGYFGEVTHKIRLLASVTWVNPCRSEETPIAWLQCGAQSETKRLLGYRGEDTTI